MISRREGVTEDALGVWLRAGGSEALDFATGAAADVVGITDRQLIVRYVNWTAPSLTREGVIGHSVLDLSPPDHRELARKNYLHVLETGACISFEVTFEGDGQVLKWMVRAGPIRADGQIVGLLTISTDVTSQRRAEADRDRFFSLSLDMLVVASPTGYFRRVNPSFGGTLGFELTELTSRPFLDFVHPEDKPATQVAFDNVRHGIPVIDFENRYRHSSGQYRVLSWRATCDPITKDIYAVARDITATREMESQLRHAQKMEAVGQLAGGVAHDFNNLLQAVLANVELAMPYAERSAELMDRLTCIADAADRAAALTKGLLAFSRRQPLRLAALDLNALIYGILKLLRSLVPESVAIEFLAAEQLPHVSVDRTQMEQVIVNLVINARDAMETAGKLTLQTRAVEVDEQFCESKSWAKPGRWVQLSVTDDGQGMPAAVQSRVFEPFFTTKGPHHGTGLGLAIVYGIVRQHGGMIDVESEPGKGATFTIHLPAAAGAVHEVITERIPSCTRGEETILLAEDETAVRRGVELVLTGAGYRLISASNGSEAVRLVREHQGPVHLAILDMVMPELNGPETWHELQALHPDLRVLFVSGYADGRARERLPPDANLLAKPFHMHDLLVRIRGVLDA